MAALGADGLRKSGRHHEGDGLAGVDVARKEPILGLAERRPWTVCRGPCAGLRVISVEISLSTGCLLMVRTEPATGRLPMAARARRFQPRA